MPTSGRVYPIQYKWLETRKEVYLGIIEEPILRKVVNLMTLPKFICSLWTGCSTHVPAIWVRISCPLFKNKKIPGWFQKQVSTSTGICTPFSGMPPLEIKFLTRNEVPKSWGCGFKYRSNYRANKLQALKVAPSHYNSFCWNIQLKILTWYFEICTF